MTEKLSEAKGWDGMPANAGSSGYHWLCRRSNHGRPVPADTQPIIALWEIDRHGQPSWWAKPFMLGSWQIGDVAREWAYIGPVAPPAGRAALDAKAEG